MDGSFEGLRRPSIDDSESTEAAPDYFQQLEAEGYQFLSRGEHTPIPEVSYAGFEGFSEKGKEIIKNIAESFQTYHAMWMAIEPEDMAHQDRRAWRNEMAAKEGSAFRDFWDKNKLRLNSISSFEPYLMGLVGLLDASNIHSPQAERIRALAEEFPKIPDQERYNALSLEEQLALAHKVDTIGRQYIAFVTKEDSSN